MFDTVKEFIADHRPENIAADADAYMSAYCDALESIAAEGQEWSECEKAEPYDDAWDEKFMTGLANMGVPFHKAWHAVRCMAGANGIMPLLGSVIVPHYGSYGAIPAEYRSRIERATTDISDAFPA